MAAVIGTQSTVVSGIGALVQFTVGTYTNQYAVAKNFAAKWGNTQTPMSVAGTDVPIYDQGKFHGEGSLDVLFSTEDTAAQEQFASLVTPVAGEVQPLTVAWTGTDISGNSIVSNVLVYPKQATWKAAGASLIKASLMFTIASRASVSSGGSGPVPPVGVSTIGTVTSMVATQGVFYAAGLYWAFCYCSSTTALQFFTSPNALPLVWSSATNVVTTASANSDYAVGFDGTYVYLAWGSLTTTTSFMRGTPQTNGTINWTASGNLSTNLMGATFNAPLNLVTADSSGYPWVSCAGNATATHGGFENSDHNDGSWHKQQSATGEQSCVWPSTTAGIMVFMDYADGPGTNNIVGWITSANTDSWAKNGSTGYGHVYMMASSGNFCYVMTNNATTVIFNIFTINTTSWSGSGISFTSASTTLNSGLGGFISIDAPHNKVYAVYFSGSTVYYNVFGMLSQTWAGEQVLASGYTGISHINVSPQPYGNSIAVSFIDASAVLYTVFINATS